MDINEYKKYAIPQIEAGKMVEIVRKVIKEEKYAQQDKDEKQKEIFKPITQELKNEIDEISDLREEFIKSANKPISYSQQVQELALTDGHSNAKIIANLDKGFTSDDLKIIQKHNLPLPSKVLFLTLHDDNIADSILNKSAMLNQKLGLDKAHLSTTKKNKQKNKDKIDYYNSEIDAIKKYRKRIAVINEGKKTLQKTGSGYNQPKRNAYKINQTTGEYGNLKIDLPKLFGQLKLIAYKDDKKVYDKNVDFDTINLFSKRYNGRKKYSDLSKMVFNDINKLSEISIHKSSKKYKKIGSGIVYYNNPKDLLSRLELLGSSITAGNSSVKNEFSEIAHVLTKLNILTNDQLKNLLKNYVI